MTENTVESIIKRLSSNELIVIDIPEEYRNDPQIITYERKTCIRVAEERGFDVIKNEFFVKEMLTYVDRDGAEQLRSVSSTFQRFDDYYTYLDGDIYDNACYSFCNVTRSEFVCHGIDLERLFQRKAFVDETISDYGFSLSSDDLEEFRESKKVYQHCQRWVKRFNACNSYEELVKVIQNYHKSPYANRVGLEFFLYNYVYVDTTDKHRFDVIMEYVSSGTFSEYYFIRGLCAIFDPQDVLQSFHYSSGSKTTINRHKKSLREFVDLIDAGEIAYGKYSFFDRKTHYYCESLRLYPRAKPEATITTVYRYFETFDEFIMYRKGDLTFCDFSYALDMDVDFTVFKTDNTTKLPLNAKQELHYSVKKYYTGYFWAVQQWRDSYNNVVKKCSHCFEYFFDFVAFLNRDLSNADLLFCDGLSNLTEWDKIDFTGARLTSALCEKFGLEYTPLSLPFDQCSSFALIEQNEMETAVALQNARDITVDMENRGLSEIDVEFDRGCQMVYYVSDLHLLHRIHNAGCQSQEDVDYVIQHIVNSIAAEAKHLLLIDGDISSDFTIYERFIRMLSVSLHKQTTVVFTLGNHELWDFPGMNLEEIVLKYRDLLRKHNMYLLHNAILYETEANDYGDKQIQVLEYETLRNSEPNQIAELLRSARYVILGGLGFSGYNTEFNAENEIYRGTVDRQCEIAESLRFEELYNQLKPILVHKNAIILTHTPKKDWCIDPSPHEGFVYVSGHTHRNAFYDDGFYRIYSDNQIGYHGKNVNLKRFLMDNDYDCFADYSDGIYSISKEQYRDFYRGKNLAMTFTRENTELYMLKKSGYYCFILKSTRGNLLLLNGGALKQLPTYDIDYYFDHMDLMISRIKSPLDAYSAVQNKISAAVKRIGGDGKIHGCIVDIDFNNHIYINPVDSSITGYWAEDMINKVVFPTVSALLEQNCPLLYEKLMQSLQGAQENLLMQRQPSELQSKPQWYLDTDIYSASREIKKMQKLYSNILSFWDDEQLQTQSMIEHL